MREQFPKLSSSQVCRFINNQLKLKVIEIDKKYKTKIPIEIGNLNGLKLFHAGTNIVENKLSTSGGRVFSLNYHGSSLEECVTCIYNKIDEIKFDGTIYRSDIGKIYES